MAFCEKTTAAYSDDDGEALNVIMAMLSFHLALLLLHCCNDRFAHDAHGKAKLINEDTVSGKYLVVKKV